MQKLEVTLTSREISLVSNSCNIVLNGIKIIAYEERLSHTDPIIRKIFRQVSLKYHNIEHGEKPLLLYLTLQEISILCDVLYLTLSEIKHPKELSYRTGFRVQDFHKLIESFKNIQEVYES